MHVPSENNFYKDYSGIIKNNVDKTTPSLSIRVKIAVSYFLFFLLCVAITCWTFWITSVIESKINFLKITDNYLAEVQQVRIFEKNYLLYGTNLEDVYKAYDKADRIIVENSGTIKKIMGENNFQRKIKYMASYKGQLEKLKNAANVEEKDLIEPQLRQYGGQLVNFAEEFVQKERDAVSKSLQLAKKIPFLFLSILLLLMAVVVLFLTRQLMKNLNFFMDYAKRVGEGDFTPIVLDEKFQNEFSLLADAFNKMTVELNHRHDIILESHKLRAIGTLVAGVAHELNNPLNNTMLTAEVLKEEFENLTKNEKTEMIDDLVNETERAQVIVKGLLDFARESGTNIQSIDIEKHVKEAVRLVSNQIKLAKVQIETEFEENLPRIHGDEQMLKQVFVNLILNAVDALPVMGKIHVSISKNKNSDFLSVIVRDNGPGIPEHLQKRIFEPFFTTKSQGKGTGLGLSVSLGIVKKLGGYIKIQSSAEEGTSFIVLLPVTESPSSIMSGTM